MNMMKLGFGTLAIFCAACGSNAPDDAATGDDGAELRAKKIVVRVDRTDLVTDKTDASLVNAWGIAFNPAGPAWISNAGTGTSTVYDDAGKLLLTVTVPNVAGATEHASPTGQVFNGSTAFNGDKFIFVTENGTVAGWQPNAAVVTRSNQSGQGAVYKGLAIAGEKLFAADFKNGKVDVFDGQYALVSQDCAFVDPTLPAGYAPFNIQTLGGAVYVAFAQQDPASTDEKAGAGKGYVSVFDTSGRFTARIGSAGALNAPWGLALAPATFGAAAGKLLVGNFGDGKINVYDLPKPAVAASASSGGYGGANGGTGTPAKAAKFLGQLGDAKGRALVVDGLWALAVSPSGALTFTAGPGDEAEGAYGTLSVH